MGVLDGEPGAAEADADRSREGPTTLPMRDVRSWSAERRRPMLKIDRTGRTVLAKDHEAVLADATQKEK